MKKVIITALILMVSISALGCVTCKDIFPAFPGATYTPTVPGTTPTAAPTISPSLSPEYITVETGSPPNQFMPNQARVSHPRYYRTSDWMLPVPEQGGIEPAHHGVIHELDFWNPTSDNKTISVYNLKSAFYENMNYSGRFIQSSEEFYDDRLGFFSQFTMKPGEHRTVLMYAYMSDADYNEYKGFFTEPVSIDVVPDYPENS